MTKENVGCGKHVYSCEREVSSFLHCYDQFSVELHSVEAALVLDLKGTRKLLLISLTPAHLRRSLAFEGSDHNFLHCAFVSE